MRITNYFSDKRSPVFGELLPYSENKIDADEAIEKWSESFPNDILDNALLTKKKHSVFTGKIRKEATSPHNEYGQHEWAVCRVTVDVYYGDDGIPKNAGAPECESPEVHKTLGAINPDCYYCKSCKKIHERSSKVEWPKDDRSKTSMVISCDEYEHFQRLKELEKEVNKHYGF